MDKYITTIKDLVFESLKNDSQIQYLANVGKPEGCFKKGMIYLLGINTSVDFKEATKYFSNPSLADDQYANCLLGFIAECEGQFSSAFHHYANIDNTEKESYLNKVLKGRNCLQDYLKKLNLPIRLNEKLSIILSDYSKDNAIKVGACVKIATICNDEQSCLEAAKSLYDAKDYISAVQWLQKGNIGLDNPLYAAIYKSFEKSKEALLHSKDMDVIDLEDGSLLSSDDPTPFLEQVKKKCEEASSKSGIEWKYKSKKQIDTIIRIQKEQEKKERLEAKAAEEARMRKKKRFIKHSVICVLLFIAGIALNDEKGFTSHLISGIAFVLSCYFWFYCIRWIWRKFFAK